MVARFFTLFPIAFSFNTDNLFMKLEGSVIEIKPAALSPENKLTLVAKLIKALIATCMTNNFGTELF